MNENYNVVAKKPLPNEEILKLVGQYQTSSKNSKEILLSRIFQHNTRFVLKAYQNYTERFELDDFMCICFEAMYKTAETFDIETHNSILTVFAFNIRGCITTYLKESKRAIDLSKADSIKYSVDDEVPHMFISYDKSYLETNKVLSKIEKVIKASPFKQETKDAFMMYMKNSDIPSESIASHFGKTREWFVLAKKKMFKYIRGNVNIENYELEF